MKEWSWNKVRDEVYDRRSSNVITMDDGSISGSVACIRTRRL